MKKFTIKFKLTINILFIVITAIIAFIVFFNIKRMFDTGFDPRSLWVYIILLFFAFGFLAVLINIAFFSKYKVNDTHIYICLGFIPLKIEINKIDKIIDYEKNNETFIIYTKNENKKTHLIFIEYSKQKEFINLLKNINRNIIYVIEDKNEK